jgi:hypothetical protein
VFAYTFAMPRKKKNPTMVSKQNPPEKEVSPAAFLNGAKRYGEAANLLLSVSRTAGTSLEPIYMLYFHAAELALKAFLVFKGEKTEAIKRRWKHNLEKMHDEAIVRGLASEAAHSMDIRNVMDCAPPAGEFSPRFEGSAIGGFGLLKRHLVFLRG